MLYSVSKEESVNVTERFRFPSFHHQDESVSLSDWFVIELITFNLFCSELISFSESTKRYLTREGNSNLGWRVDGQVIVPFQILEENGGTFSFIVEDYISSPLQEPLLIIRNPTLSSSILVQLYQYFKYTNPPSLCSFVLFNENLPGKSVFEWKFSQTLARDTRYYHRVVFTNNDTVKNLVYAVISGWAGIISKNTFYR